MFDAAIRFDAHVGALQRRNDAFVERLAMSVVDYGQRLMRDMASGPVARRVGMRTTIGAAAVEYVGLRALHAVLRRRHALYATLARRTARRLASPRLLACTARLAPLLLLHAPPLLATLFSAPNANVADDRHSAANDDNDITAAAALIHE
jgi:hypothetical protein